MAEKKYQVFISSTFSDLKEERRKLLDVLLMADCIPAGMESFVASDIEQFEVIKQVIQLCDYYILIIGKRYGSVNESTGISYTEMEYEYAKELGIPVLVFALDESVEVAKEKMEIDPLKIEALNNFRQKALTNRLASIWKTQEELVGSVAISIMRAIKQIQRPGWQRAVNYDEASLRKQIMDLTATNKNLQQNLQNAQKTIDELTTTTDIAFEEVTYEIKYTYSVPGIYGSQSHSTSKVLALPVIFEAIATKMMDVSINEKSIERCIKNLLNCSYSVYLSDDLLTKRILNQLRQLGLIQSSWDENSKTLYWDLTAKGIKTRDDKILIKKQL